MYPPLKKINNPLPCLHEWEWVEESEPSYLWQGFVCEKCGQRNEYRPEELLENDPGYDAWTNDYWRESVVTMEKETYPWNEK